MIGISATSNGSAYDHNASSDPSSSRVSSVDACSSRTLKTDRVYLTECQNEGIPSEMVVSAKEECKKAQKKLWTKGGIAQWLEDKDQKESSSSNKPVFKEHKAAQTQLPPEIDSSALVTMQRSAKADVLNHILNARGDTTNPRFLAALAVLSSIYLGSGQDARTLQDKSQKSMIEGSWSTLSRPTFQGCLGTNEKGQFMYSLGRMSFDMFRPTELKCSIRGMRNEVKLVTQEHELPLSVPWPLRREVQLRNADEAPKHQSVLRTHNIVIDFIIEPRDQSGKNDEQTQTPAPSSPIRAVMTNEGYMLADPDVPNRFTVWFTGGELVPHRKGGSAPSPAISTSCSLTFHECQKKSRSCALHGVGGKRPLGSASKSSLQWEHIFGPEDNWKRSLNEKAKVLAAKVFLGAEVPDGMEEDGTMRYTLHRPIGRHGSTYVDVLYLDEDLAITKGNFGTVFVQSRQGAAKVEESQTRSIHGLSMGRKKRHSPSNVA